MSPSAARHVAKLGNQSAMLVVAMGIVARCSRQYVLNVAKILKCHSSPGMIDRYTVEIATARSD